MKYQLVDSCPGTPVSVETAFTSTATLRSDSIDSVQEIDQTPLSFDFGFGFFLELSLGPEQTLRERNTVLPQDAIIALPFLLRSTPNPFLTKGLSFVGFSALAGTRQRLGMLGSPMGMAFAPADLGTYDEQDCGTCSCATMIDHYSLLTSASYRVYRLCCPWPKRDCPSFFTTIVKYFGRG